MNKTKERSSEKVEVHSNGEGKLYIYTADLFALKNVQDLIKRAVESKAVEGARKLHLDR